MISYKRLDGNFLSFNKPSSDGWKSEFCGAVAGWHLDRSESWHEKLGSNFGVPGIGNAEGISPIKDIAKTNKMLSTGGSDSHHLQ